MLFFSNLFILKMLCSCVICCLYILAETMGCTYKMTRINQCSTASSPSFGAISCINLEPRKPRNSFFYLKRCRSVVASYYFDAKTNFKPIYKRNISLSHFSTLPNG